MEMIKYFNEHVILDVVTDNNVYQVKGKVIGANENIVKLETYKHRKVNRRYLNPKDIVGVEVITFN